jgi:hypothetical protein
MKKCAIYVEAMTLKLIKMVIQQNVIAVDGLKKKTKIEITKNQDKNF